MRFLAIIPARGGSKSIPKKNIKDLIDKPLIVWSIQAAKKSKYLDRIIVSTDDEEIKNVSLDYGAEVPFLRPQELAKDDTPSSEAIYYTMKKLIDDANEKFEYLILLQPTSPLRDEKHIDNAIEMLLEKKEQFDSLVSVTELEHPVYWNRVIGSRQELNSFLEYDKDKLFRRQDFEKTFRLNGAIYLIEVGIFMKYKSFETDSTMAFFMDRISSTDIDTKDDFEIAEFYLRNKTLTKRINNREI
ncbi:acylneuraminate cytidylyltransferase family protein [Acetobacterium tundrae]|uniref:Acylneuraminate cytidylyltransferase family protein n=2 Tax=Acetobacterium tundrae TaxID=132932 RepID=A0ABR6WL16_9FIRM|nr:acylneuraminate cytidylyltransferase family protein [Acetobacterium tundrae]